MLFLVLLLSSFLSDNISVSNAENSDINGKKAVDILMEKEREEYINMYKEIYKRSLIQQIEFESELIIPDYIDFKYVEYTYELAGKYNLSARTAFRLMFKESSFIDTVKSTAGAEGLMQLMPNTRDKYYTELRVDTLNLDKNQEDIYIGMNYLIDLYKYWKERGNSEKYSWKLSLASYNAGIAKVIKYKGIPPYKETNDFIVFITKPHSNPAFYANILKREKYENVFKDRA